MSDLRLVLFDVDGTLVDSQADILGAMSLSFDSVGLPVPEREAILQQVGLSLEVIFPNLVPHGSASQHAALVEGYKSAYMHLRQTKGSAESSPLFPGARAVIDQLHADPETLLGVATGKSRRGLDKLLDGHGLRKYFVTQQVADHHPSKPHPAMVLEALNETGVSPDRAVMVGDTSYDMEMAKAAGVFAIGVDWGYHHAAQLTAADVVISKFAEVHDVLNSVWG
ncbi:HAD-IA family hydrolase [Cognatishimia sp. SS12]|uniref:HAD-IA family hydrolase n=1 Tax=Cognatishimia sp. SS12 TaxID=2979465 RepID=UPI00232B2D2B|nr:HAD-IA family hydrolase [Cognatishimia sp. SS12]MDC0738347.1 HAD-IA family hydrolase [Cognatishimia sp. SS12]